MNSCHCTNNFIDLARFFFSVALIFCISNCYLFLSIFFLMNASLLVVTACEWISFPSCTDLNTSSEKAEQTKRRKKGKKATGMYMNLFFSMPKIVNMFHILLIVLTFVFHPLNTDQGTSDKNAKQINRSDQSIEQAGMSINFMFQHSKKHVLSLFI